jgi:disulfide bond formation protein DsbB
MTNLSARNLIILAGAGSFGLLGGAFIFQALGYAPCAMCIWQRWPHAAAILLGVIGAVVPSAVIALFGAGAALTTGIIGVYHTGVERDWWEGPSSCTGAGDGIAGLSGGDLLATTGPKLILCDQVSWEFLTLSMPSWNALFSFVLAAVWIAAAMRSRLA